MLPRRRPLALLTGRLIRSRPGTAKAEESTDLYYEVDRIIPRLKAGEVIRGDAKAEERESLELTGDYIHDEKHKTATLTESGIAQLVAIAERTEAAGLNGRVAVSHAFALGSVPTDLAERTADLLAEAGVAIMSHGPGGAIGKEPGERSGTYRDVPALRVARFSRSKRRGS